MSKLGSVQLGTIPPQIRSFLIRALICFLVWQGAYQLFLKPGRYLDKHVTNITAYATAKVISSFYGAATIVESAPKAIVFVNGKRTIGIADGCNALELFVLYLAFLICMPATNRRRLLFALIGVPSIFVLNVLRCYGIAMLHIYYPRLVDFAHHYVFAVIVYAFLFYLLTLYSRQRKISPDRSAAEIEQS